MAFLVDISSGNRYGLGASMLLGRDDHNHVRLDDLSVSRRHAAVQRTFDGRYMLVDLGSTSGTYLGRRRVFETILQDGDEFFLGGARLRFETKTDVQSPFMAELLARAG